MWRTEPIFQPYPVGDALNQPPRARVVSVILPAVHHLVPDDAEDLGGHALGRDAGDVVEAEVDLLVVRVDVAASGVGDALHGAEDERYRALAGCDTPVSNRDGECRLAGGDVPGGRGLVGIQPLKYADDCIAKQRLCVGRAEIFDCARVADILHLEQ